MSTEDAGYSPLSYHNGTVWPHDNSLIAAGLDRYGYREEALRIVRERRIDLSSLVTHSVSLDQAGRAFELAEQRPPGFLKAVVRP